MQIIIKPLGVILLIATIGGLTYLAFQKQRAATLQDVPTTAMTPSAAITASASITATAGAVTGNLLRSPADPKNWELTAAGGAAADVLAGDGGTSGDLKIVIKKTTGQDWQLTLRQGGLDFQNGDKVTIRFSGRSEPAQALKVWADAADNHPIWTNWGTEVAFTSEWKDYTYTFAADKPVAHKSNAPVFALGMGKGTVFLKNISVTVQH